MDKTYTNFFQSIQYTRKQGIQEVLTEICVTVTGLGSYLSCLVKDIHILS